MIYHGGLQNPAVNMLANRFIGLIIEPALKPLKRFDAVVVEISDTTINRGASIHRFSMFVPRWSPKTRSGNKHKEPDFREHHVGTFSSVKY